MFLSLESNLSINEKKSATNWSESKFVIVDRLMFFHSTNALYVYCRDEDFVVKCIQEIKQFVDRKFINSDDSECKSRQVL